MGSAAFRAVVAEARACVACRRELPHAPRPVFHVGAAARLLIVGQAPGRRVHETGIPWNDPSGEALREWLAMGRDTFYDLFVWVRHKLYERDKSFQRFHIARIGER